MSTHGTQMVDAAIISTKTRMDKGSLWQRGFSVLLFSVFVVVDLLALVAGASSYGSLIALQQDNDARIMSTGPIVSSVRAYDSTDSLRRDANAPEGDALVLVESDNEGTYETRIYLYEGSIVQEYALAESPYSPNKATVLAESSVFEFEYEDGLLTITTDAGTTRIALRSDQGGA